MFWSEWMPVEGKGSWVGSPGLDTLKFLSGVEYVYIPYYMAFTSSVCHDHELRNSDFMSPATSFSVYFLLDLL